MNHKSLMQSQLPVEIYDLLESIGKTGHEMNYPVFVVGGFVRDLLMGNSNLDIDIVVEGDGIAFAKKFAVESDSRVKSHDRFGTAVVTLPGGFKIDVATARTETYSRPGALPDVSSGFIKDDLFRRDFTINAMAIELNSEKFGELVDFFDGVSDIQNRHIKVLHDLSFVDDPTRMFRAVRFEQRFGFSIEPYTKALMEGAISGNCLKTITGQRLRNEILLILGEARPLASIHRMAELNLTEYIHPAIHFSDELARLFYITETAIGLWNPDRFQDKIDKVPIRLLAFLDQLNVDQAADVSRRLALTNVYAKALRLSKTELPASIQRIKSVNKPSVIYDNLKQFIPEILLFSIGKYEEAREKVIYYLTELHRAKPWVNGKDLKEMGYPEGPLYAQILNTAFANQLDGLIGSKNEAMDFIKKQFPL